MAEDPTPEEEITDMSLLTLEGHRGSAFACAISVSDGRRLAATGGEDDCARVWDLDTGALLFTTSEHKDSVTQVCFSQDGRLLATGDMSGLLQVFGVPAWRRCWQFELGSDLAWLAWHPLAASALLAGSDDGSGWLWKMPRGDVRILAGHGSACTKGVVLPDGTRLLAGYQDGSSRLFNLRTGEMVHHLSGGAAHSAAVSCVAAHPDNALLAAGSLDGFVRTYSATTGKLLATLPCCPEAGGAPADGDDDEAMEGAERRPSGSARTVEAAAFCADAGALVTATCGGVLVVWDLVTQRPRHQLTGQPGGVSCLRLLCGTVAVVGCLDGSVLGVDVRGGTLLRRLTSVYSSVLDLVVCEDGETVLAAMDDGKVRVFNMRKALENT